MRVVPKEAETGAGHGTAEDGQLRRARIARQLQVLGELRVAAGIGQHGERAGGNYHEADGQAVQPVRQVDRVGAEDHHQCHENAKGRRPQHVRPGIVHQRLNQQRGLELFDEGNVHGGVEIAISPHHQQDHRKREPQEELIDQLGAARESQVALPGHFGVIVHESDPAVTDQSRDGDPHVGISQVRPQQRGHHNRNDNEDSAHGGRAGLLLVGFRAFLADVLSDLKFAQLVDEPGPQRDAQEQSRDAGERRAEGSVPEDTQRAGIPVKLFVEQEIEHEKLGQKPLQRTFHVHSARAFE